MLRPKRLTGAVRWTFEQVTSRWISSSAGTPEDVCDGGVSVFRRPSGESDPNGSRDRRASGLVQLISFYYVLAFSSLVRLSLQKRHPKTPSQTIGCFMICPSQLLRNDPTQMRSEHVGQHPQRGAHRRICVLGRMRGCRSNAGVQVTDSVAHGTPFRS